ncbi:MAG: hypothetical protein LC797_06180 [Chloroflexi bacterium]|nr:hypothetical protein [Chloroflexota bacterium]
MLSLGIRPFAALRASIDSAPAHALGGVSDVDLRQRLLFKPSSRLGM